MKDKTRETTMKRTRGESEEPERANHAASFTTSWMASHQQRGSNESDDEEVERTSREKQRRKKEG